MSPQARDLGFVPLAPDFHETGDFCMDIYEFPNIAGVVPAIQVTYADAEAACTAIGKRLCTEAEFERACGGPDGWHQPYGPDYRPGYCNNEAADVGNPRWLAPSGSFFHCVTPEGIYDLEGNLSEWVAPAINIDDPAAMPQHSPVATTKRRRMAAAAEARVVRGGTMWQAIYGRGCPARHTHPDPGPAHDDDGFRCCADPSPAARGTFRPSPEKQ